MKFNEEFNSSSQFSFETMYNLKQDNYTFSFDLQIGCDSRRINSIILYSLNLHVKKQSLFQINETFMKHIYFLELYFTHIVTILPQKRKGSTEILSILINICKRYFTE